MEGKKSWLAADSYGVAIVVAIVIHVLVAGLFLIEWPSSDPVVAEPVPQHMIANVVQVENKAVKERKRLADKKRKQKLRAQKRRKEKARQAKLKKQRLAKEKRKQEKRKKEKQEQLKRDQLAKQKKALLEKQQAEEQAQRDAEAQAEKEREEQAMLEQLAQEQAQAEIAERQQAELEAKEQAEKAAQLRSEHTDLIRQQITSVWRYPPAVDASQEVTLRLVLVPTGEVVQVQIISSSGNQALDRSVEQAIRKASPLPVPKDIAVFEQSFRTFTMKFRPENATW